MNLSSSFSKLEKSRVLTLWRYTSSGAWPSLEKYAKVHFVPPMSPASIIALCLLPPSLALNDGDVAIDRQVSEALDGNARPRPFDFQPIDLGPLGKSQNNPRIVR